MVQGFEPVELVSIGPELIPRQPGLNLEIPNELFQEIVWDATNNIRLQLGVDEEGRPIWLNGIREIVEHVPKLDDWGSLSGEQKKERLLDLHTQYPLWASAAARTDHRGQPLKDNEFVTPYFNPIVVWTETLCRHFGVETYWRRMTNGELDQMVMEMGSKGLLIPGQAATEGYLGLGSSTGETPSLRQYYEALKVHEKIRMVVERKDLSWEQVSREIENIGKEQNGELKSTYEVDPTVGILRTQSGSEAELLLFALLGITASMYTNETGTSTGPALEGMHPSKLNWMGKKGLEGKIEGYEKVGKGKEIKLRGKDGKVRGAHEIAAETEEWIGDKQKENPEQILALHVTAGAKTGIGWQEGEGGLTVKDAVTLREKYKKEGMKIYIVADASQGRISNEEINELLQQGIIVNVTGSKFPGGPMFSHAMFVPEEIKGEMVEWVSKNGLPVGIKDYVVKGDLADVLPDNLLRNLYDLPDVISMVKWAAPIPTMREYNRIAESDLLKEVTASFVQKYWLRMNYRERLNRTKTTWHCEQVRRPRLWQGRPSQDMLISFYIEQDGRRLVTPQAKKLFQHMSDVSQGQGVHPGQAVEMDEETREAILRVVPSQEVMLRIVWEYEHGAPGAGEEYVDTLVAAAVESIGYTLETKMVSSVPLVPENWEQWVTVANTKIGERLANGKTKVESRVKAGTEGMMLMLAGGKMKAVALTSWKNSSIVAAVAEAHEQAGCKDDLAVAFVDHPYVSTAVYEVIRKTLIKYPKTHLHVAGATKRMNEMAKEPLLKDRITMVSQEQEPHEFVRSNPRWTEKMEEITPQDAAMLNLYYKEIPLRTLVKHFKELYKNVPIVVVRGNRRAQEGRATLEPIVIAKRSKSYFVYHPFLGLSDQEFNAYLSARKIYTSEGYLDVFKEAIRVASRKEGKSGEEDCAQCGVDFGIING